MACSHLCAVGTVPISPLAADVPPTAPNAEQPNQACFHGLRSTPEHPVALVCMGSAFTRLPRPRRGDHFLALSGYEVYPPTITRTSYWPVPASHLHGPCTHILEALPLPGFGQIRRVPDIVASAAYPFTHVPSVRTPRHSATTPPLWTCPSNKLCYSDVLHVPQMVFASPEPKSLTWSLRRIPPAHARIPAYTEREGG
jgi:hypothetical protein